MSLVAYLFAWAVIILALSISTVHGAVMTDRIMHKRNDGRDVSP